MPEKSTALSDQPVADLSGAMVPDASMLKHRRSIPVQATRFAVFNWRMLKMITKGHH